MPKFTVLMQQYVEMITDVEVEAETVEDARAKAKELASTATWKDGDDAYSVDVYSVLDESGVTIWER